MLTACTTQRILTGRTHRFDLASGWCEFGCGTRDDGLAVTLGGTPQVVPPVQPLELDIPEEATR